MTIPYDEMVADLRHSKMLLIDGLTEAKKIDHQEGQAEINAKLNIVTYLLGQHEQSLEYGVNAIDLFGSLGQPRKVGGLYCAIGYQMKRRDIAKASAQRWTVRR